MNLTCLADLPAPSSTQVYVDLPNVTCRAAAAHLSRPDWHKFLARAKVLFGPVEGSIFVNEAKLRPNFFPFARKVQAAAWRLRYCLHPIQGFDQIDPVDSAVQAEMAKLTLRPETCGGLVLVAHDGGYAPYALQCLAHSISVTIVGFGEFLSPKLLALRDHGARFADLEYDFAARTNSGARPSAQTLARLGLCLAA